MLRRLKREWFSIQLNVPASDSWMRLIPRDETKLDTWDLYMLGPDDSLYAGGEFHFVIRMPDNYPFRPYSVTCLTPILHPNIVAGEMDRATGKLTRGGHVCIEELSVYYWSSLQTLGALAAMLVSLLASPNFSLSLSDEASALHDRDPTVFATHARAQTRQHAMITVFVTPAQLRQVCIDATPLLPELAWLVAQFVFGAHVLYNEE
jgi:ubiquitin-protein ligase